MLKPDFLRAKFAAALPYNTYVKAGQSDQQATWQRLHERAVLTDTQKQLLSSFTRQVQVLVSSGIWCGDCAAQVPMLDQIAKACPSVRLAILDRDEHPDLAEQVMICGGLRVPTVLFLNEDFEFVAIHGDKSLARMRAKAAKSMGAACPLPGEPLASDEVAATLQDWVRAFEYAHLVVRLSPKLRERHGD